MRGKRLIMNECICGTNGRSSKGFKVNIVIKGVVSQVVVHGYIIPLGPFGLDLRQRLLLLLLLIPKWACSGGCWWRRARWDGGIHGGWWVARGCCWWEIGPNAQFVVVVVVVCCVTVIETSRAISCCCRCGWWCRCRILSGIILVIATATIAASFVIIMITAVAAVATTIVIMSISACKRSLSAFMRLFVLSKIVGARESFAT